VILARTNRQLFDVQRIAATKGIKYRNLGKRDFFDQAEIKALLTFLKDRHPSANAAQSLQDTIEAHGLYNRYRHSGDPLHTDPVENMNNLVKMAATRGTVREFQDWVRRITYGRKSRKEKDLTLSTIHLFKGREANRVFLIGCEQDRLPHKNGELTEEARIFYVACSRPAKTLQISWSGQKSMFIDREYETYAELENQ
jgi:DNA helicase-2/ATP-dependent DNA helicase PcrA